MPHFRRERLGPLSRSLSIAEVAAAPKNTTRRVPTLRELDDDLKHAIPSCADGLDMSLLTQTLVPPEMVRVTH